MDWYLLVCFFVLLFVLILFFGFYLVRSSNKGGKDDGTQRSPVSVDEGSLTSFASKRHKANLSISSKETKEKFGESIAALQQLVSPYGKTDTASVLQEAMEYIRFLQEQVKVLSAPYLQSTPTSKMQELEAYSLRNKGLCLVPVSCTVGVAGSNGADIWAPIKTSSAKF